MKVWLVRLIEMDQQNDEIIGIFDSQKKAEEAVRNREDNRFRWVSVDKYEVNICYVK